MHTFNLYLIKILGSGCAFLHLQPWSTWCFPSYDLICNSPKCFPYIPGSFGEFVIDQLMIP